MSCVSSKDGSLILCGTNHPRFRFHVGNRYVWMEFHPYCGPMFSWDRWAQKPYYPEEEDPIWDLFYNWLERYPQPSPFDDEEDSIPTCA
jgi:hypothetical protein